MKIVFTFLHLRLTTDSSWPGTIRIGWAISMSRFLLHMMFGFFIVFSSQTIKKKN